MAAQYHTIKLITAVTRQPCRARRGVSLFRLFTGLLLLLLPLLVSCRSVRPVVKIGLLAPFEGVQRRTGYAALTAMRLAISDADSAVALIPLALDEGADPETARRSAQKLLLAQDLGAVVGPTTPASLAVVGDVITTHPLPWYVPYTSPLTPDGRADPADFAKQRWLLPLIQAVARVEQQRGQQRLLVAGGTSPWPAEAALGAILPILRSEDVAEITAQDAVFWVGDLVAGARYLCRLRAQQPTVPFWLGLAGDTPLVAELCPISGPVAFVTWLDDGYVEWAQAHDLPSPLAYLTYRATRQAIAQINDEPLPSVPAWQITYFTIQPDGSSVLANAIGLNP